MVTYFCDKESPGATFSPLAGSFECSPTLNEVIISILLDFFLLFAMSVVSFPPQKVPHRVHELKEAFTFWVPEIELVCEVVCFVKMMVDLSI